MKSKLDEKLRRRAERLKNRDLRPAKRTDEVFISGKRSTYHDHWCTAVNGVWLSGSNNIHVVGKQHLLLAGMLECSLCAIMAISATEQADDHMDAIARGK